MSLLLDARKKLLHAQSAQQDSASQASGTSEDDSPLAASEEVARSAGHNLFAAKSQLPVDGFAQLNRNLLLGLGIAILVLGGAAYLWRASASNTTPAKIPPLVATAPATAEPVAATVATPPSDQPQTPVVMENIPSAVAPPRETPETNPIRIEHPRAEQVDPLLGNAYEAYRNGKLDEAQQMYQTLLRKDAQNADALLGLASIAQQRGDLQAAVQYYAGVLALDPRNAAANAGMAALNEDDDNNETRLKLLLREQGNSAVLHFALGNLYAGQSRWSEAQQSYFNAVTLEPGNAEFAYNLAVSLDHLGQDKPAAQYYQRALQLDPLHSAGFDHAQVSGRITELGR